MKDTRSALLDTALALLWSQNYSSTSVDAICQAAGVRKGSFYHYFPSKAELAVAALEKSWEDVVGDLDQLFSPQRPPLERFRAFIDFERQLQAAGLERCGYVLGCPYTALGSEQCHCDDGIQQKAYELLVRLKRYFISALCDAQHEGVIERDNVEADADDLFTYFLGVMAQARVSNSLAPFDRCYEVFLLLLGLTDREAVTTVVKPGERVFPRSAATPV